MKYHTHAGCRFNTGIWRKNQVSPRICWLCLADIQGFENLEYDNRTGGFKAV